jgi:hypothetical protein
MKFRVVEGAEREQLMRSRKPAGFNYHEYTKVLSGLTDGDVVAVEVAERGGQRGEKIRFSRAARMMGKSVTWLTSDNANEIAFQIGPPREKRSRANRAS